MRNRIVRAASSWIGTPYRHGASVKGIGTDCLGLLRGVWRDVIGDEPMAVPSYTPDWAERGECDVLLDGLRTCLVEIAAGSAEAGDVLVFRMALGAPTKHCAILTRPDRIVHAYWGRAVCATHLVPWWQRRVAAAFRFPDVEA